MEIFEHLSMVVFLVLGIGMVKLMTSFGSVMSRSITARSSDHPPVRFYWVHSLLVIMVFIGMVVFWWNAYPLNRTDFMAESEWNLFLYLLFLCSPMTYFLMSDVLMPKDTGGGAPDLKEYYYTNCRLLIGLAVLLQLFSLLNLLVFFDDVIASRRCISRVVLLCLLTPLLFSKNELQHKATMSIFFGGFLHSLIKYHTHF